MLTSVLPRGCQAKELELWQSHVSGMRSGLQCVCIFAEGLNIPPYLQFQFTLVPKSSTECLLDTGHGSPEPEDTERGVRHSCFPGRGVRDTGKGFWGGKRPRWPAERTRWASPTSRLTATWDVADAGTPSVLKVQPPATGDAEEEGGRPQLFLVIPLLLEWCIQGNTFTNFVPRACGSGFQAHKISLVTMTQQH